MAQFNTQYMHLALEQAHAAKARGEIPIGAVVIDHSTNTILAAQGNRMIELNDPTAHAEILAIREASEKQQNLRLTNCSLYSTLEPCPMCAHAISLARIDNLYFGAEDIRAGGVYHGAKIFEQKGCNHKPIIYDGILGNQCEKIIADFFQNIRQN